MHHDVNVCGTCLAETNRCTCPRRPVPVLISTPPRSNTGRHPGTPLGGEHAVPRLPQQASPARVWRPRHDLEANETGPASSTTDGVGLGFFSGSQDSQDVPSPLLQPPTHRQRVDEDGHAVPGSQDSEMAAQAHRALDMSGVTLPLPPEVRRSLHCPVIGCPAADPAIDPGWPSVDGQRGHVDLHLIGELPGKPSPEWLAERNLTTCVVCGFSASRRVHGGVHSRCWPRRRRAQPANSAGDSMLEVQLRRLPSIQEVFTCPVYTKEYISEGLLPLARSLYKELVANVVHYNVPQAWDHLPPESGGSNLPDTIEMKRARKAWIELSTFAKA